MRKPLLPWALAGMMAATVGCAQSIPTTPSPSDAATETYQVQQAAAAQEAVPASSETDPVAGMMGDHSAMADGVRAPMGRRHTSRRRGTKHKFFAFKGFYFEAEPVGYGKGKMGTTRRRMGTTRRRGSTTSRRSGRRHHAWWSFLQD